MGPGRPVALDKHVPQNACPGLDPRWTSVRRRRSTERIQLGFAPIELQVGPHDFAIEAFAAFTAAASNDVPASRFARLRRRVTAEIQLPMAEILL
jgi:hypothetical protein